MFPDWKTQAVNSPQIVLQIQLNPNKIMANSRLFSYKFKHAFTMLTNNSTRYLPMSNKNLYSQKDVLRCSK